MKAHWSPAVVDDLEAALDYIEFDLDSPKASKRFYQTILDVVRRFSDIPTAGIVLRNSQGLDTGFRYMIAGNWMIFFVIEDDGALVVRILVEKATICRYSLVEINKYGEIVLT